MTSEHQPFDPAAEAATDPALYEVQTHAAGPAGSLPLDEELLRTAPSGDLFGLTQNAGMGWDPRQLRRHGIPDPEHAGRHPRPDGTPGRAGLSHRPLGGRPADAGGRRGIQPAAAPFPSPASCTDPCDGRTQGTPGMMDSLAYRNDAAIVLRRLIRSLPTRRGRASASPPATRACRR